MAKLEDGAAASGSQYPEIAVALAFERYPIARQPIGPGGEGLERLYVDRRWPERGKHMLPIARKVWGGILFRRRPVVSIVMRPGYAS
jgi:hypothetical protein